MVDLSSGKTIRNVVRVNVNRECGDIVFQPGKTPGKYAVYYLPFKQTGATYFPNTVYDPPVDTAEPAWRDRNGLDQAGLAEGKWRRLPRGRRCSNSSPARNSTASIRWK